MFRALGNIVKLAFALTLYSGFLTHLSKPLGTPDIFSGVYHPSPTTKSNAVPFQVSSILFIKWCYIVASIIPSEITSALPFTLYYKNYTTTSDCSKPLWGLLFPLEIRGMITTQYVHQARSRDSRNLVTPFMQVDNKSTRYYATLRTSELGPLFTRDYHPWKGVSLTGSEQESATIQIISDWQWPVFLINSRASLVIATWFLQTRHPLFRRYRAILPSSLGPVFLIRFSLFSQSTFPRSRYDYLKSFKIFFLLTQGIDQPFQAFLTLIHITALYFFMDLWKLDCQTRQLGLALSVKNFAIFTENVFK